MSGFLSSGIAPSLVHAVDVVLQRLDKTTTIYDPIYREPISESGPTYKAAETVLAQIKWRSREDIVPTPGGNDDVTDGYILMLDEDVQALVDGPFKVSDKILSIDGRDYSNDPLFIVEPMRAGHYREGRLWKFWFAKRDKVQGPYKKGTTPSK